MRPKTQEGGDLALASEEDAKWLSWVESRFRTTGVQKNITKETFISTLNMQKSTSFFAERLFALFKSDGASTLTLKELMDGLRSLSVASQEDKLKFLFRVYDVDGNGFIDEQEVKTVLQSCMEESSLQLTEDDLDLLTAALFEAADEDNNGEITFEELLLELKRHPGVLENFSMSTSRWFTPSAKREHNNVGVSLGRYLTKRYYVNNCTKVVFLILFTLLNIALFISSVVRYRHTNGFIMVARGCGMCLNFNCAFIVVFMLRKSINWLRSTRASHFLPLDHVIYLHKVVGVFLTVQSVVHTLAHLGNLHVVVSAPPAELNSTSPSPPLKYWEYLFTLRSGLGWIGPGFGFLSGVILLVLLVVMILCSLPVVRRSGHFQVFYWTHMLSVPFWLFLILHGPIFWYFFIIPGFMYLCELIGRNQVTKQAKYGKTFADYAHILPSKVVHLVVSRHDKFIFKPGDYVFVKIPEIAAHEWHPFTISSAPELKNIYWLHIRSAGHWTNELYSYVERKLQENVHEIVTSGKTRKPRARGFLPGKRTATISGDIELRQHESWTVETTDGQKRQSVVVKDKRKEGPVKIEILVDGPYGTPTRHIFNSDHPVLIASGIGVTPYAAILQSIMFRYQASRVACPNCNHCWFKKDIAKLKMKKVDFIWINRDQKCFEWFVRLLAQLELQQTAVEGDDEDPFLDMQLYMTAAASAKDMKGLGLQMAMEIMHQKEHRDVITGLKTRTQAGRPDWHKVFSAIKQKNAGKVCVFFCGSPVICRVIRDLCAQYGFAFSKENF